MKYCPHCKKPIENGSTEDIKFPYLDARTYTIYYREKVALLPPKLFYLFELMLNEYLNGEKKYLTNADIKFQLYGNRFVEPTAVRSNIARLRKFLAKIDINISKNIVDRHYLYI